ncbi:hypothetical protein ACFLYV_01345 [Chloroflexota bacterium]
MRKSWLILSVLFFVMLWPSAVISASDGSSIEAVIVNGTAGYSQTNSLTVNLITTVDGQPLDELSTIMDENGLYRFTGLTNDVGYTYQLTAIYKGVEYASDLIELDFLEITKTVDLQVYETTADSRIISSPTAHIILYPGENNLLIKEFFLFNNNSDRTYLGTNGNPQDGVLIFQMPDGALGLEISQGPNEDAVLINDNGFADTMPLYPGNRVVAFSYSIGLGDSSLDIPITSLYALNNIDLLLEGEDYIISSGRYQETEQLNMGELLYTRYILGEVVAGEDISFRLEKADEVRNGVPYAIFVLGVIAIAGFVVLRIYKRRKMQPSVTLHEARLEVDTINSTSTEEWLINELAELDDAFEQGELDEKTYREQRTAKKARLSEIKNK